jgi:hypothetical protein
MARILTSNVSYVASSRLSISNLIQYDYGSGNAHGAAALWAGRGAADERYGPVMTCSSRSTTRTRPLLATVQNGVAHGAERGAMSEIDWQTAPVSLTLTP